MALNLSSCLDTLRLQLAIIKCGYRSPFPLPQVSRTASVVGMAAVDVGLSLAGQGELDLGDVNRSTDLPPRFRHIGGSSSPLLH